MLDLILTLITLALVAITIAYSAACDALLRTDASRDRGTAPD